MVVKLIGGVVAAVGVFLWCGNVFGFFPTFPLAGYVTILVGGVIVRAGR